MVKATIYKNKDRVIYGFKLLHHSESIVCSAISVLAINTANSIEAFTDASIECKFDENGGFLFFELPEIKDGGSDSDAVLLLKSLELGLESISQQYKNQIKLKTIFL